MRIRSLFWRLFIGFWLVISALLLTHWGTTWLVTQQFETSERLERLLNGYADAAVAAWQRGGAPTLNAWKEQLHAREGLRVTLLNADGHPLHRPGRMRGMMPLHEPGLGHHRGRRPLLWSVNRDGQEFTLMVFNPRKLRDPLFAGFTLLWRILLSIGVVGVLAWLMARYLTRPIETLRRASRELAAGELATRVSDELGNRRDELGELGHDFDLMAERIQTLLEGQQQLLRDVSHELRTPLARQRIALELARRKEDPAQELDRIEQEAELLDQLIEEILLLVRLSSEPPTAPQQSCDLAALVQNQVTNACFEEPRVDYQGPEHLEARVDPRQLARALENVIRNALKYSTEQVEVRLETTAGQARIRVDDRGPGIDEAQLSRIFDPFVRADSARSRDAGGWGLGLAIAARALKLHGGRIEARNRAEGGLSVVLSLPLGES